jgi:hypothetical protein
LAFCGSNFSANQKMDKNSTLFSRCLPKGASDLHLYWVQPSMFERHFELHSDNSLLGVLDFGTPSTAVGTLVTEGSAMESWTFKGAGIFFKAHVTIRNGREDEDLAVYRHKFLGDGWVDLAKGKRFYWKSTSFWGTQWSLFNSRQELLFVLKPKLFDLLKVQADVEVGTQWLDLEELPLLLMLGWYLRVRDSFATR